MFLHWTPGQRVLVDFEVVRPLGAGGMATTYLLRDRTRSFELVAKVPANVVLQLDVVRFAILREIRLWESLQSHPNVAEFYFLREIDGVPVLFNEYVASGTLTRWIEAKRIHGAAHAIDLAIQLAEGMRHAQTRGIVHRDLKPSNCLMEADGTLKISDFGLSIALRQPIRRDGLRATALECVAFAGTQAYCSPEQLDLKSLDSRSDVWSFGVTMLEMLTGRRPMIGSAAPYLLESSRNLATFEHVPDPVWDFVGELLRTDVRNRPASFAAIRSSLTSLYEEVAGRQYSRTFPHLNSMTPATGDLPVEILGESSETPILLLRRALELAGRDPAEAAPFADGPEVSWSPAGRAYSEIFALREAKRVYVDMVSQPEPIPDRNMILGLAAVCHALVRRHEYLGDLSPAVDEYDELVQAIHGALRQRSDAGVVVSLVEALQNRAVVLRRQHGNSEALRAYDKAIAMLHSLDGLPQTKLRAHIAALENNRAMVLLDLGRLDEALRAATLAIAYRERPTSDTARMLLARSLTNRGVVTCGLGDTASAIRDYADAIALCEKMFSKDGVKAQDVLVRALVNRSVAYHVSGNSVSALTDCDRAIARLRVLAASNGERYVVEQLGRALNNRSNLRREARDLAGSLADADECIALRERAIDQWGMRHLQDALAMSYSTRCLCLLDSGDLEKALKAAEDSLGWVCRAERMDKLNRARVIGILESVRAATLSKSGRSGEAVASLDRAFEILWPYWSRSASERIWLELLDIALARSRLSGRGRPYPDLMRAWVNELQAIAVACRISEGLRRDVEELVDRVSRLPRKPKRKA